MSSSFLFAEAEYTFQLRKPIIPLMMQRQYKPDGWLGMMLGAKLYINFDGKHDFDTAYQMLLREMKGRDKPSNSLGELCFVLIFSSNKLDSNLGPQLGLLESLY